MPTIDTLIIRHTEDLALLESSNYNHIEVYLNQAILPILKLNGSLKVRAKYCQFPNLISVKGNLSIDAEGSVFSKLEEVFGHLNIHEKHIELPQLKFVLGQLKILEYCELPKLKVVTNGVKSKGNSMFSSNLINCIENKWTTISKQSDFNKIKHEPYRNIKIELKTILNQLTIDNEYWLGSIEIVSSNCNFSSMVKIGGDFIVRSNTKKHKISSPHLKEISGHCTIYSFHQNIQVESIKGKLFIEHGTRNTFPTLKKVGRIVVARGETGLIAPELTTILKQSSLRGRFSAPKLEVLNVDNDYYFQHKFPNLKKLNGDLRQRDSFKNYKQYTDFENLEIINGNYYTSASISTNKLKHVYGFLDIDEHQSKLESIQTIGELIGVDWKKKEFLRLNRNTIEHIGTSKYFDSEFSHLIKSFFHEIKPNEFITVNEFYFEMRWTREKYILSLKDYVKLLKMKHSSFKNYISREVDREWTCSLNPDLKRIINRLEHLWSIEPAYSFEDIFKLKNQNVRRFSFNYVGVSDMMKALNATRVATDGIKVKYLEYDLEGHQKTVEKHNVFETYQADLNQISDLKPQWSHASNIAFAVKCWCTSTNKEHWLWIEEKYKDEPLEAIASTFRIHENVIPHIKCLKRQGDVLICEMNKQIIPEGLVVPLTAEQYFNLLLAES
ncbi:MAG: hypothetical protein ACPGSD_12960 [Flavobacteriales bacterium]